MDDDTLKQAKPWTFWRAVAAMFVAFWLFALTAGLVTYGIVRLGTEKAANDIQQQIDKLDSTPSNSGGNSGGNFDSFDECMADPNTSESSCSNLFPGGGG